MPSVQPKAGALERLIRARKPVQHGALPAFIFIAWCFLSAGVLSPARADDSYAGKTIRFVVGVSPGGGFDVLTRMIARHFGKRVRGTPSVIVENMPGAGSLVAANHVYNVAKPDGLTIGMWNGGLVMRQVLRFDKGFEFEAPKFNWLGVPVASNPVCAMTEASGITTLEKWAAAKSPVKIGGIAPGIPTDDIPKLLRVALGLPVQVVEGYKGTADIRLAADSGEVSGACWGWESMRATWPAIGSGKVKVVLQAVPNKIPELPHVPNAIDHAKTPEARQLIEAGIHDPLAIIYLYSLAPGTPKERVKQLRAAFMDTMADPEFLAEAKKGKQDIKPVSGEEVERIVLRLFKLEPALIAKIREIVAPKR